VAAGTGGAPAAALILASSRHSRKALWLLFATGGGGGCTVPSEGAPRETSRGEQGSVRIGVRSSVGDWGGVKHREIDGMGVAIV